MKPEIVEWIERAEGDWKVAQREMQTADPIWNVVCFLVQQCSEK
ncbi:MAG: HEPN domain-containing protein [Candidatus Tectomicrobia bacterium]|nr:HEPN domain-containing protein [Candidatus Tectomicrobia bacterium]